MKKVIKISGYIIAVCFTFWFIFSPVNVKEPNRLLWRAIFSRFTLLITATGIFWIPYYKILWKWKWGLFRKAFFDQPNLSGTWMGYLKTDYLNSQRPMPPIKITFFIRQTNFFNIRIISQSASSAFFSFGETLEFDPSSNMIRLLYQYSQKTTLPNSRDDKQGAADLMVYENYIAGHYWTIVKTSGFIRVNKVSNEICQSFEEADKRFGNEEILQLCYSMVQGIDLLTL